MKSQVEWISEVSEDIKQTLISKDADYGSAFSQRFKKHGLLSAFIRLEDKFLRLENLMNGAEQKVKGESIVDTLRDICGYAELTIIELLKQESEDNG